MSVSAPKDSDASSAAFATLVREHLDFVWRLLRRWGLSPADADDAAQQVFMLADRKLDQIEGAKARAFLYGTAVRVAANFKRSLRRRREVPHSEPAEQLPAASLPEHEVELSRGRALLDELLSGMPVELARVLVLAEVEQQTLTEIAELEAIPRGTAASRLRRAREQFSELLAQVQHRNPFESEDA